MQGPGETRRVSLGSSCRSAQHLILRKPSSSSWAAKVQARLLKRYVQGVHLRIQRSTAAELAAAAVAVHKASSMLSPAATPWWLALCMLQCPLHVLSEHQTGRTFPYKLVSDPGVYHREPTLADITARRITRLAGRSAGSQPSGEHTHGQAARA